MDIVLYATIELNGKLLKLELYRLGKIYTHTYMYKCIYIYCKNLNY
jgi:hypothetical protein